MSSASLAGVYRLSEGRLGTAGSRGRPQLLRHLVIAAADAGRLLARAEARPSPAAGRRHADREERRRVRELLDGRARAWVWRGSPPSSSAACTAAASPAAETWWRWRAALASQPARCTAGVEAALRRGRAALRQRRAAHDAHADGAHGGGGLAQAGGGLAGSASDQGLASGVPRAMDTICVLVIMARVRSKGRSLQALSASLS